MTFSFAFWDWFDSTCCSRQSHTLFQPRWFRCWFRAGACSGTRFGLVLVPDTFTHFRPNYRGASAGLKLSCRHNIPRRVTSFGQCLRLQFPCIVGTFMANYIDSLKVLPLALHASQTCLDLWPMLHRFDVHGENLLFILWWIRQNKLHYLCVFWVSGQKWSDTSCLLLQTSSVGATLEPVLRTEAQVLALDPNEAAAEPIWWRRAISWSTAKNRLRQVLGDWNWFWPSLLKTRVASSDSSTGE